MKTLGLIKILSVDTSLNLSGELIVNCVKIEVKSTLLISFGCILTVVQILGSNKVN